MKITLAVLLFSFSTAAQAASVSISLGKACAYADDSVIEGEKVQFSISTHSHDYAQKQDSPIMNITPGYCLKEANLGNYQMNVPVDGMGSPLEIQVGSQLIGKVYKLSYGKIVIGTTEQLARHADCTDSDLACINVDDLAKESQTFEIATTGHSGFRKKMTGIFELSVSLIQ